MSPLWPKRLRTQIEETRRGRDDQLLSFGEGRTDQNSLRDERRLSKGDLEARGRSWSDPSLEESKRGKRKGYGSEKRERRSAPLVSDVVIREEVQHSPKRQRNRGEAVAGKGPRRDRTRGTLP